MPCVSKEPAYPECRATKMFELRPGLVQDLTPQQNYPALCLSDCCLGPMPQSVEGIPEHGQYGQSTLNRLCADPRITGRERTLLQRGKWSLCQPTEPDHRENTGNRSLRSPFCNSSTSTISETHRGTAENSPNAFGRFWRSSLTEVFREFSKDANMRGGLA